MKGKNYIYDYRDYRAFLVDALGGKNKRTGQRGALARHLGCQTAYLSQVLSGTANFSLEQAYRVNQFFAHDPQAAEYFLLLVQKDRAGIHELKDYFQSKLNEISTKRTDIKTRVVKNKSISEQDQAFYYSHWYISAVHIALSIPQLQTAAALARHFHLEDGIVRETLDFLTGNGLAVFSGSKYAIGPSHIHLPKDSKFIKQLHSNWRMQAIHSLEKRREEDLHYSVTYSLSKEDVAKIRKQILDVIEQNMEVVRPSKEEVLYCHTIDFFEVKS